MNIIAAVTLLLLMSSPIFAQGLEDVDSRNLEDAVDDIRDWPASVIGEDQDDELYDQVLDVISTERSKSEDPLDYDRMEIEVRMKRDVSPEMIQKVDNYLSARPEDPLKGRMKAHLLHVYLNSGRHEEALEVVEDLLENQEDYASAFATAEQYLEIIVAAVVSSDYLNSDKCIQYLDLLEEEFPDFFQGSYYEVLRHLHKEQLDQAQTAALDFLDKRDLTNRRNLGDAGAILYRLSAIARQPWPSDDPEQDPAQLGQQRLELYASKTIEIYEHITAEDLFYPYKVHAAIWLEDWPLAIDLLKDGVQTVPEGSSHWIEYRLWLSTYLINQNPTRNQEDIDLALALAQEVLEADWYEDLEFHGLTSPVIKGWAQNRIRAAQRSVPIPTRRN